MIKRDTTITITGVRMTKQRQAQVGQAIRFALAHQLDGEIADVAITFHEADF